MPEPLCGWQWYHEHQRDHTQSEIDSLTIELEVNGKLQARFSLVKRKTWE